MINYKVYWKDQYIGNLCIEGDRYQYVPNLSVITSLQDKAFLVAEVMKEYNSEKPIQFFKHMIDNCVRFNGRSIEYHNNNYSLMCE